MDRRICFLSTSAVQADREIVDWFLVLLKEYGVKVLLAADRRRTGRPRNKIKDDIRKSNIFVGIVTRRAKIESKQETWRGSTEVQKEIAFAYTLRKPISVFVEDNVQLEHSMTPHLADFVRFDRRNLASIREIAENHISALLHLSEYLRAAYGRV